MKLPDHLKIFISGSFFLIIGNLLLGLVNYLTRRCMALTLSDVQYGYFYGAFALVSIVLIFLDLGITDAGTVLISENQSNRKTIFWGMWKWKALLGGGCALLLLIFSPLIAKSYLAGENNAAMMVILSIYVAFQTLNGTFISYTYGCKQYHIKSLFQIIKALLLLVLVWFLTISYGVCGAAMGYLLSTIVIEPVHLWWVFSHERNSPLKNFTSDLKKRMFSLMSAVATITFMQTLILHMNSVMLMILQGARSTAIYNIATPVTQLLLSFMVFSNVFLPLAVDMAGKQEYGKLRKYAWWGMIISLLMMPIVYVVMKYSGEFLITIMFKSTYASDAAQPLLVLTLGFLLYNFGSFITQILIAMHKTRILLWLSGVTVILNIVLNYILIKAYNVTGAALATALSYLFFAAAALAAFYYCTCNAQEKE